MIKNDEKKVAALREIRATLKAKRITTIELAKKLSMDSANLSDYLFFRKLPSDQLIENIEQTIEAITANLEQEKQAALKQAQEKQAQIVSDSQADLSDTAKATGELAEEPEVSASTPRATGFEYSVPPLKLGDKIKAIREKMQLSQEELAATMQPPVAVETVKFWESNFGIPLLAYCIQLSDMGVVTLDWLLKD